MATTSGTISTPTGNVKLTYTNEAFGQVELSGTYAGFSVVFEFSPDDTNWFGICADTPGEPVPVPGYTLAEDETRFFSFSGLQNGVYFRVRATARTSGTLDVSITTSS